MVLCECKDQILFAMWQQQQQQIVNLFYMSISTICLALFTDLFEWFDLNLWKICIVIAYYSMDIDLLDDK